MQQATLNLFADMGVQPTTRQPDLKAAALSADHTAPTARITAPASGPVSTGGRDDHRHGVRRRRAGRRGRGLRPTAARPGTRPRAAGAGATTGRRRRPASPPCSPGPPTTARTSAPRRRRSRSMSAAGTARARCSAASSRATRVRRRHADRARHPLPARHQRVGHGSLVLRRHRRDGPAPSGICGAATARSSPRSQFARGHRRRLEARGAARARPGDAPARRTSTSYAALRRRRTRRRGLLPEPARTLPPLHARGQRGRVRLRDGFPDPDVQRDQLLGRRRVRPPAGPARRVALGAPGRAARTGRSPTRRGSRRAHACRRVACGRTSAARSACGSAAPAVRTAAASGCGSGSAVATSPCGRSPSAARQPEP